MSLLKRKHISLPEGMIRYKEGHETLTLYTGEALEGVRRACKVSAGVLARLCDAVKPGMTTLELDDLAGKFMHEAGGKSADFGYCGFPRQACISVNDVVVHGVGRKDVVICPGDVVSLDITVNYQGWIGDNARTVIAGGCGSPEAARLIEVTRESMLAGIDAARVGNRVGDIGTAVQAVADAAGYSVVRDMVGHGCGYEMHEAPQVPNYRMTGGAKLRAGMVICIEPMVNVGTWRIKIDRGDGWTVRTADGSLSAHFENQILITEHDPEILTWQETVSN